MMKKKIAVCYFSYAEDVDFLNESLKALQKTIHRSCHEVRVYVFDDLNYKKTIKRKELSIPCTLIGTRFNRNGNLNGYECIEGMFDEYIKIHSKFDYDYLIKLDSDCILNSFDNITAIEARLMKQQGHKNVSQIGSYFAQICCYGCCQTFSPMGIASISNIFKNIRNNPSKNTEIMKKRIQLGWNEDKVVSLLLEMSPISRGQTEAIEGVKGHVNAFEHTNENYWNYISVAFKPNKYGMQSWTREQSLEVMKNFVNSPYPKNDAFHNFLRGKTVALVGNAIPNRDCSAEIDSADVVIRLNNFYNYDSGRVGRKTDCLVLNGIAALSDDPMNGTKFNNKVIVTYKPQVFILNETFNQDIKRLHDRYKGCNYTMLGNDGVDICYTTGTILLKMLSTYNDVKCKVFAFDTDDKWKTYVNDCGVRHLNCGINDEEQIRLEIISKFK